MLLYAEHINGAAWFHGQASRLRTLGSCSNAHISSHRENLSARSILHCIRRNRRSRGCDARRAKRSGNGCSVHGCRFSLVSRSSGKCRSSDSHRASQRFPDVRSQLPVRISKLIQRVCCSKKSDGSSSSISLLWICIVGVVVDMLLIMSQARHSSCCVRSFVAGVMLCAELICTVPGVMIGVRSEGFSPPPCGPCINPSTARDRGVSPSRLVGAAGS